MNNDKIIITSFSVNFVTNNVDVFCYLPSIHILGFHMGSKTVSFPETELLPDSNWSNEDLKTALATVTNVPTTSIFYYNELTDEEQYAVKHMPVNNQFVTKKSNVVL